MTLDLFAPFTDQLQGRFRNLSPAASQFHHWAYYRSYLIMLAALQERAVQMVGLADEIGRMGILLSHFVGHLESFAHIHIQDKRKQLIDTDILGTFDDYNRWQDFGYNPMETGGLPRNKKTYKIRVRIWQQIYDGEFAITDDSEDGDEVTTVTYEEVIAARMDYAQITDTVPYWMFWNYGSNYKTGRDGYPAYGGIHFLEIGESSIPESLSLARRMFIDFASSYMVRGKQATIPPGLMDETWQGVYRESYPGVPLITELV
jgi:hypothetical protein